MITMLYIVGRILAAAKTLLSDPARSRGIMLPGRHAGVTVDHEIAMKYSAVYRAVAYISQSVAGLPWEVLADNGDRKTRMLMHPVWRLIRTRPNDEMAGFTWRETMLAWALTWGNGYSEIERDQAGRTVNLWPLSPDRVTVRRNAETGKIEYEVLNYFSSPTILAPEDVFHLHGLGFDGLTGYSVITMAARSIGLSIASEMWSEDFFGNGAVAIGGLRHPEHLSDEAYERLKKQLSDRALFGHKWHPMILEEGMEWATFAIPAKDAQALEMRQFQVTDIARWFGLPPHKLADLSRATFSNIEQQSIEVVNDALIPWIHRMEQEADRKLLNPSRDRNLGTKMNVRGLLRGDDKSRAEYYQIMRNIGVYSTNAILRLEDMDPVGPEGDELLVQLNQTTLKKLVAGDIPKGPPIAPKITPKQLREGFFGVAEAIFGRFLRRESNRFEQSTKKLVDVQEIEKWSDDYFTIYRDSMEEEINKLAIGITGAASLTGGQAWVIRDLARNALDEHEIASKKAFLSLFEGKNGRFSAETRAKDEAESFISAILAAIAQGGNHHALSE